MRRGRLGHYNGSFYAGVDGSGEQSGVGALLKHCKVMLERVPMGCLIYDADFKLVYANPAALSIFGYSAEELLGTAPEFLVSTGDSDKLDRVLERLLQGESDTMSINRNRRKDGSVLTCSWINTPLYGSQDSYVGMLSMVRDISGNIRLVEDLKQMVERYETLTNNMAEGMVIADKDGRYIYANPAMEQIFGGPVEEIIGRRSEDFVLPEEREFVALQRELRKAGQSSSYQTRIRAADGSTRVVEVSGAPRYDTAGAYDGLVALIQDVTARVQAETALRESEERYRLLFDANPQPMLLVAVADASISMANAAAAKLYGYSLDEFRGLPLSALHSKTGTDSFSSAYEQLLKGSPWSSTVEHQNRSGGQLFVELHSNPVDFGGRDSRLLAIHDQTQIRQAQERTRASERLAAAVIANSPIGVTVRDRQGQLLLHNRAWLQMWGATQEVIEKHKGQSFSDFEQMLDDFYGADSWRVKALYREGGSMAEPEIRLEHERAAMEWISQYFYSIMAPDGSVEKVVTLTEDISVAKRAEQKRQAAEQLAQAVIEASPLAVSVRDNCGRLILFNEAWRSLYRMSDEDIQRSSSRSFEEFCSAMQAYYAPADLLKLENVYRNGGESFIPESPVTKNRTEDEWRWVSRQNYAITDAQGAVQFVVTLTRDITEEKQEAEELRVSEQLHRAVVDNSPLGISVRSSRGRLLSYNKAWLRIRGLDDEGLQQQLQRDEAQRRADVLNYYGPEAGPRVQDVYDNGGSLYIENLRLPNPPKAGASFISQHMYSLSGPDGAVDRVVILTQDVSAAHAAADAIRHNEERFRLAAAVTSDALYEWDARANRTWRSDSYFRLFGLEKPEDNFTEAWFTQHLHPDDRDSTLARLREVIERRGAEWSADYRFRSGCGEYREISDRGRIIYDDEGRPLKMVGAISDVTERNTAARQREQAERLSSLVIHNAPIGITVRDASGRLLLHNERWREIWQVEEEELKQHQSFDLQQTREMLTGTFGQEEADNVMALFSRAGTYRINEVRWQRGGNPEDLRWLSILFCSVEDSQGQVSQMVSLTVDSTDAAMAEHRLRDSEKELRQIIDLVPHFIFAKDAQGRYILVNQAVADAYGTSVDGLVGRTDADFNPDPGQVTHFCEDDLKVIATQQSLEIPREEITTAQGQTVVLQTVKIPFTAQSAGVPAVLGVSIDISAREQMEKELRDKEKVLLDTQNLGRVGSWKLHLRSGALDWTPATYEIFGLDPADGPISLENYQGMLNQDDYVELQEKAAAALRQRGEFHVLHRMTRKDGELRYLDSRGRWLFDANDEPEFSIGLTRDVTEQVLAEQALRYSETRLLEAQAIGKIGSWELDLDSGSVTWSPEVYRIFGLSPETFQPSLESFVELIHPDDREMVRQENERVLADRTSSHQQFRVLLPDGSLRWINSEGRFEIDKRTGHTICYGISQDITERVSALRELQESEARYRTLLELVPDAITVSQSGRIVFANAAAASLAGCADPAELIQREIEQLLPMARQSGMLLEEGNGSLQMQTQESRAVRDDGTGVDVESVTALISYDGEPAFLNVTRDISERRRAEASLRLRDDMLEAIAYAAPHFTEGALSDDKIRDLLVRLGLAARVSCVYLLERVSSEESPGRLRKLHEWSLRPELAPVSDLPYADLGLYELEPLLGRGQPACGSLSELSPGARESLAAYGACAYMIVPLFIGQEWWGFIGVEDRESERQWSTAETDVLKLAANLLGASMARLRALEQLRQSEERYRSLVNVAPDGVYVASGGVFRFANPTLVSMLGLSSADELVGRRVADYVHPDFHDLSRDRRRQLEEQGGILPVIEEVFLRADGTPLTVEVASTTIRYADEPAAIVVLRDVSERKQAMSLVRLRDEILRSIAYSAPQFLAEGDWNAQLDHMLEGLGKAASVSRVFVYERYMDRQQGKHAALRSEWSSPGVVPWRDIEVMLDFAVEGSLFEKSVSLVEQGEVVQKSRSLLADADRACMDAIGSQSLLMVPIMEGREHWGFIGFDAQDAERSWSEAEVDALRLASTLIGASIARQRSNERLSKSEERYRSLVDVSPDGVLVCRSGRVEFANATMARLIGAHNPSELEGRSLLSLVHPDYRDIAGERFRLQHEQLGTLPGLDERWLRLDGTPLDVEVASALIDHDDEPQSIVVVRDITDRKQAQSSLRMRDAILEAIAKVAPKLLAGPLSRDLRNELLEGIGRAANVSRVAVYEFDSTEMGTRLVSCRSEWVAAGIQRYIDNPWMQEQEFSQSPLALWETELRGGGTVQGTVSSFPEELRESLAALDLQSLLLAPIFVGNEWWGNIGFDDCAREREWSYAEVDALKLAASLIGAAVQRERAQADLQASEERLRMVTNATSDALYDWDIQQQFVWRSASYYDFFNLEAPRDEESEGWWDEHVHPEDRDYAVSSLTAALGHGEERWSCEYRFRRGDGSYAEVSDRGLILRDSLGRPLRMIGAISDITARSQGERRLKESEERYRLLAENSSDMISKNTPEGIFTYVSDSCYDLLGYRKEEMLGTSTYDYFHPDDLEQVARSHSAVLRGQSVQSITYRFRRKDGSYVWFETLTRPAQDDGLSSGVEIIATSRDVTERRQAELALRESEQRYRTLYNNTPVMLHSIDREGRIISVSDYWLSVMGYTRGEVLGRNALEFVSENSVSDAEAMMTSFMEHGYCQDVELQFIRRSGDRIDVLISAIAERNEDGSLQRGLAVMADITDRKRAQRQLQLTVEQLKNIYDFSHICGQSGSQEELLAAALDALRNTVRPLKAGLLLPRSESMPRFAVWLGLGPECRQELESFAAWNAELADPLLCADLTVDGPFDACRESLLKEAVRSIAYLPVKHLNRIIGWCVLGYERAKAFNREERQLAETILSQLGSAMERRRGELELRESERGLARAQELAHLGSWQWGIESGQTIWSDELFRILGLDPGQFSPRGLTLLEYVHPLDQDGVHAALQGVLDNGQPASLDFRILRPSGDEVYVHAECFPELSPLGQILRVGGTIQDITERVLAENELLLARDQAEQNRVRASAILDAAPEAIIMIDEAGIVDTYSEGAERIFGYRAEEVIGQRLNILMHEEDIHRHEDAIQRVVDTGRSRLVNQSREVVGRHQDGHSIDLDLTIRDTYIGGRRMFVGVMRDISERKRMQSQLRQSQKMEAIGTLAGGIAHDFNNILQSILGYTGLARDSIEGGHEAEEYLSVVMKAGLRARDLVQQILAFSRQSELQLSVVDLSLIVRESTKLLRAAMPATISIRTEMLDRDVHVLGDPVQLHQVLMNLCTNAGYAMRDTGGTLSVSLRRVFWDAEFARFYPDLHPGMHAELQVSDTGTGMSKEVLERIFEPFYTTKPVGEGTGMGLSVVHGIIHSLGGAIHVSSDIGKGTTFKVFLPMVEAEKKVEERAEPEAPIGNERILLVDDEEAIAEMVSIMLSRLGYRVTRFTDPRQALREFSEHPADFDLLITDQTMPFMTGASLSAKLLELRRDLPIIVCTGYSEMFTPEQAQEMGVQAYLFKPVGMMDLAQTIRQVLGRNRPAVDAPSIDKG
ncbi:PAS domain S-box protein [bacterium]|nr:PAS domain S-box protein [bacterium]